MQQGCIEAEMHSGGRVQMVECGGQGVVVAALGVGGSSEAGPQRHHSRRSCHGGWWRQRARSGPNLSLQIVVAAACFGQTARYPREAATRVFLGLISTGSSEVDDGLVRLLLYGRRWHGGYWLGLNKGGWPYCSTSLIH
ncbi:hypothetical protein ACQJBY_043080 [Aegilops geniculata]